MGYYKSKYINDFTKSGSNAASFKMGYVIRTLKDIGEGVKVVSWCPSDYMGRIPLREVLVDEQQTEVYLPSFRIPKAPMRITAFFRNRALYRYFLRNVKKEDTVIVYHATSIAQSLLKAKAQVGFKLILEVEEIYHADAKLPNREQVKVKEEALIAAADSYIVVNDLIYDQYIHNGKPYMVLYGVYDGKEFAMNIEKQDERTQLLFSGSIDKVRGSELAVEVAKYLPRNYCLNICGAGAPAYVDELTRKIQQHNQEAEGCEIIYHGQLSEEALDTLALSCDIGLNLQDINNPFEAVSFPSKITFYLQHGLNVVSTKMSSVLASKLAGNVIFGEDSAMAMAKAIEQTVLRDKQSNMRVMKDLDANAHEAFKNLI